MAAPVWQDYEPKNQEQEWKEQAALTWCAAYYGPDFDPFENPETFNMAEKAVSALYPLVQQAIAAERGEPVGDKKTMTVTLTDAEINALEALSKKQELSPPRLLIQGLRLYQLHHERLKAGETVVWSGDDQRARDFAGPLATPAPTEAQIRADERERCASLLRDKAGRLEASAATLRAQGNMIEWAGASSAAVTTRMNADDIEADAIRSLKESDHGAD